MAFSVIRRATDEDYARLNAAWQRFCRNNNDPPTVYLEPDLIGFVQCTYEEDLPPLLAKWERAAVRALRLKGVDIRHPVGVGDGYVGTSGW